jgi:hypothetical protein
MTSVKEMVELEFAEEIEVLGENLIRRHFIHHKSHITWTSIESGPLWWEADD